MNVAEKNQGQENQKENNQKKAGQEKDKQEKEENGEKEFLKDNFEFKDYLIAIVQGWVSGALFKLDSFRSLVLGAGLQYALYAAFDEITGKDPQYDIVKDFLQDIIVISFITFGYEMFKGKSEEDDGFLSELKESLVIDVLISIYFALKDFFQEKNGRKETESVVEKEKEGYNIMEKKRRGQNDSCKRD